MSGGTGTSDRNESATFPLPMFPLGGPLLPGALLPLHVFEERYRIMVRAVTEGGGRFGVVMIERGSEVGGGDVRAAVGCIAQIVESAQVDDGRWAILAVGAERFRITRWLSDDPYPLAEIALSPDDPPRSGCVDAIETARDAFERVAVIAASTGAELGVPERRIEDPLAHLRELVAQAPLGPLDRHRLLCAAGPSERAVLLAEQLDDLAVLLAAGLDGDPDAS